MVVEGEEEIGSPHIPQLVRRPEVIAALKKTDYIFLPDAAQDTDGSVTVQLGAKGVVELELVSSGERWGRGPAADLHSSEKARVDSPAWHLVASAAHTRIRRWQHACHSRVCRQGASAICC